jgi:hypothetical protein
MQALDTSPPPLTSHQTTSRSPVPAKMTTSCLKVSKRQRGEMTGAIDSSKDMCWTQKSTGTVSPRCRSTKIGFGVNKTIDFDSSLPACFIGLSSETRWSSKSHSPCSSPCSSPRSQRRTILCDTMPRLPNRDTLPRRPIRADAIQLDALAHFAATSHGLLSSELGVPEFIKA